MRQERFCTAALLLALGGSTNVAWPWQGRDGTCVRRGSRIVLLKAQDHRGDVLAALAVFKSRLQKVNVDSVGIGYYMAQHLRDHGLPVEEINVGERARDSEKCSNRKAELYWGLRLRAQDGDLAGLTDERTIAQLAGIRYSHNSRGQVVIESKEDARKRGVRSPDRAEAVMLAFAETKLVFGFIEYLRSLQQALDAEQSAARSGTQDASGLDGGGHHPPCPDCGSIATARVSIEWRCNQCGRQFGGQPNAVLRISRHEVLDRFWRN